jgi:hypothetical protein
VVLGVKTSGSSTPFRISWEDKAASCLYAALKKQDELSVLRIDPKTNSKYLYIITKEYLKDIIDDAYEASINCPGWGPRRLVALKLVAVAYGESRFDSTAIRLNTNGTLDFGIMQVNSCHLLTAPRVSEWFRFCRREGIDPTKMKNLWIPETNMAFAALLNEDFIQSKKDCYTYYKSDPQKGIYDILIKSAGFEKLAIKYNDGQYIPQTYVVVRK